MLLSFFPPSYALIICDYFHNVNTKCDNLHKKLYF
nr:MAG TPA: hypothetical protein [Caudoviricetes sp.]DAS16952.1 MAG TPA: hypothetical protein [Caudoviricetes sp.]